VSRDDTARRVLAEAQPPAADPLACIVCGDPISPATEPADCGRGPEHPGCCPAGLAPFTAAELAIARAMLAASGAHDLATRLAFVVGFLAGGAEALLSGSPVDSVRVSLRQGLALRATASKWSDQ
jgi:hypothetical protein